MNVSFPVLLARNVTKSFPSPGVPVEVLHRVDLAVDPGEFMIITGPSGSGKTTFLNLAAMLDSPTTGELLFDNEDTRTMSEERLCDVRKRKVGMVFQDFHLLPQRSALENVTFRFRYLDDGFDDACRRAEDTLRLFGLGNLSGQSARLLSSGEMQRVAIARAVVVRPRLLLADEPTGNLDAKSSRSVMDCFRGLNRDGITIVMVTHDESLLEYCSRHVKCESGHIGSKCRQAGDSE